MVERAPPAARIARVEAATLGDRLTLDVTLEPARSELVPLLRAARGTGELAARAS